jgi:alcohol dehydrogenase (NADP+)
VGKIPNYGYMMIKTIGYAARTATSPLEAFALERRELRENDVQIEILYCGVCYSDIDWARNRWRNTHYPVIPGHEVVGQVIAVGANVHPFKKGDLVAASAIIDSCGTCPECQNHQEQYCQKGPTFICNGFDKFTKGVTYGGFSKQIVLEKKSVLPIPQAFKKEDLASIAPLLCAGITTYSPLKHWNIGKGHKVGIVGIGGLGHLAVKCAHALGAEVVAITSSPDKRADARRLGASEGVLSTDQAQMGKFGNSLDFIINTIPVAHDLSPYLKLLKRDGAMCLLGIPSGPHEPLSAESLIARRKSLTGSLYGSIDEIRELLEFAAEHKIRADVEVIAIQEVNKAFDRIMNKEVRYRYVIDMSTL